MSGKQFLVFKKSELLDVNIKTMMERILPEMGCVGLRNKTSGCSCTLEELSASECNFAECTPWSDPDESDLDIEHLFVGCDFNYKGDTGVVVGVTRNGDGSLNFTLKTKAGIRYELRKATPTKWEPGELDCTRIMVDTDVEVPMTYTLNTKPWEDDSKEKGDPGSVLVGQVKLPPLHYTHVHNLSQAEIDEFAKVEVCELSTKCPACSGSGMDSIPSTPQKYQAPSVYCPHCGGSGVRKADS